jgi:hypothetical protein
VTARLLLLLLHVFTSGAKAKDVKPARLISSANLKTSNTLTTVGVVILQRGVPVFLLLSYRLVVAR